MTKKQRREFMFEKIKSALRAIQNKPEYSWGASVTFFPPLEDVLENPIAEAAEKLWIQVNEYVDGKADEESVKLLYKSWVGMYAR